MADEHNTQGQARAGQEPPKDGPSQTEAIAKPPAPDVLPSDVLERLRKEIKDACELLEFAVSEGERISDQTIEQIKKAQKFLHPDNFPSESDRAAFEKAYRDLT